MLTGRPLLEMLAIFPCRLWDLRRKLMITKGKVVSSFYALLAITVRDTKNVNHPQLQLGHD